MFIPIVSFETLWPIEGGWWYQTFLELERRAGAFPLTHRPGRSDPVVVWCTITSAWDSIRSSLVAMHEAVDRVGTGVRTREHLGNTRDHVLLERELADLHGKEASLVFATGYVTNEEAAVSTFAGLIPECIVYSDALHQEGVAYVKSRLREAGLPVMPSETPSCRSSSATPTWSATSRMACWPSTGSTSSRSITRPSRAERNAFGSRQPRSIRMSRWIISSAP